MKTCKAKLTLEYPCQWTYKVIGTDQIYLENAIAEIITKQEYSIEFSKSSSSRKYLSLNIKLTVYSEKNRNSIYENLKSHPHIKMVL